MGGEGLGGEGLGAALDSGVRDAGTVPRDGGYGGVDDLPR